MGLIGGAGLSRFIATEIYQVTATDPLIYGTVALVLATVALLACLLPARRASNIDPMEAPRYE